MKYIANLTGLGANFNDDYYLLSSSNMSNNTVNGASGIAVYPTYKYSSICDIILEINGVSYFINDYIDKAGTTHSIIASSAGFNIDYSQNAACIALTFNNSYNLRLLDTSKIYLMYE